MIQRIVTIAKPQSSGPVRPNVARWLLEERDRVDRWLWEAVRDGRMPPPVVQRPEIVGGPHEEGCPCVDCEGRLR